jgi:FtsP/CotA-like multicopper oxidase with cupredoxin domain
LAAGIVAAATQSPVACTTGTPDAAPAAPEAARGSPEFALPNDNRASAGMLRDGVLKLEMEARPARWQGEASDLAPEAADPSIVDVLGFAEAGGTVRIPGPLIRVPEGTEVRVRVRNAIPPGAVVGLPGVALREAGMSSVAGDVLVVHGLRAGTAPDDTLLVPRGEVGEVRYRADRPGTYFYWASASQRPITSWTGIDAQLAGAIIVDPAGAVPDPDERIFVITMLDQLPDPDAIAPQGDYFRRAINGRSWPNTERFQYTVGETVRWRWINATFDTHPMHLHGFHYRLIARGDGTAETIFPEEARPLVVTEHMHPGSTFRMEWVPTRAGNWIFHCHILDHITPAVERDEEARAHDLRDVEQHALDAMAGLVVGITVTDPAATDETPPADHRLRLVAHEELRGDGTAARGFALQAGAEPVTGTPTVPGPPLLLTRGETTEITVINQLTEPTTIHWHGLELESAFDGVAGWSRTGSRIAPLIGPGESFAVRIKPPRAGTFIYHTHMDETDQLAQGMIGPFLVLEPGETYDPEQDRVILIAGEQEGDYPVTINGSEQPAPITFRAGTEYRLRFIHITRGLPIDVALTQDGAPVRWTALAKDGANLPRALQLQSDAELRTQTGETFDFLWTPEAGDATLVVRYERFSEVAEVVLRQTFRVR